MTMRPSQKSRPCSRCLCCGANIACRQITLADRRRPEAQQEDAVPTVPADGIEPGGGIELRKQDPSRLRVPPLSASRRSGDRETDADQCSTLHWFTRCASA